MSVASLIAKAPQLISKIGPLLGKADKAVGIAKTSQAAGAAGSLVSAMAKHPLQSLGIAACLPGIHNLVPPLISNGASTLTNTVKDVGSAASDAVSETTGNQDTQNTQKTGSAITNTLTANLATLPGLVALGGTVGAMATGGRGIIGSASKMAALAGGGLTALNVISDLNGGQATTSGQTADGTTTPQESSPNTVTTTESEREISA